MKRYILLVSSYIMGGIAIAYAQQTDTLSTDKTEKASLLNEVVITGQFQPQSMKNSVYQVRSISAEKIRLSGANNVQQVLNTVFGFRFSNDLTLGTTDVELMGVSGRNIKILLDGVPMVDRSDTRESLNQIDVNTIERIEIVEGPISVIYGTDALAGVVNIITKNAGHSLVQLSARIQDETAGEEYGVFTGKGSHHQHLSASWQQKGWSILAGATHQEFGGWNLAPKTASIAEVNAISNRWKPKEQWLGNTKIGYRHNNFNIWYRLDGLQETIDSRGGINLNNYKAEFQTYTTHRYGQQLQSEWKVNKRLQLSAVAAYTNLERATRTLIHDFTNNTETLSKEAGKQDVATFKSAMVRGISTLVLNHSLSFQAGLEYNRDAASGARIKGAPYINDYALFISSEVKPLPGINIRPGFRFIQNSVYDAPLVIPSLNTKFALSKMLDLRLSYARGFRAPALRELYYDFFDASHSIIGNENLKAEESDSYNGSLTWTGLKIKDMQFRSALSSFYNLFKNRIEYGVDANNSTVTTLINISKYRTAGFTLDNTFIYKDFQANIGLSYVGRYNNLGDEQPQFMLPEFVWSEELTTNLSYTIPKINGSISLFYKYAGARPGYQLNTENGVQQARLVKVGAFNWADLMLHKNLHKYLTLNLGVKNLFNITQLSNSAVSSGGAHSSGGGSVPYSYGRSYVLGLTINWDSNKF